MSRPVTDSLGGEAAALLGCRCRGIATTSLYQRRPDSPMSEGVELLHWMQDVYPDDEVGIA